MDATQINFRERAECTPDIRAYSESGCRKRSQAAFVGPSYAPCCQYSNFRMPFKNSLKACDEGNQWTPILTGELERARNVQKDLPMLTIRERLKPQYLPPFLHSQPIGQKGRIGRSSTYYSHTPDIDPMSVEKGLTPSGEKPLGFSRKTKTVGL